VAADGLHLEHEFAGSLTRPLTTTGIAWASSPVRASSAPWCLATCRPDRLFPRRSPRLPELRSIRICATS